MSTDIEHTAIGLVVNGRHVSIDASPLHPLAHVLRDELGLTGTKLGCSAGDCGSCTVLVDDVPVASCLVPVVHAAGREVMTIEGISDGDALHPLQEAFRRHNACQCGYCIPGLIMASLELIERDVPLERAEVRALLAGNLCRCTGYDTIVDAIIDAQGLLLADTSGASR